MIAYGYSKRLLEPQDCECFKVMPHNVERAPVAVRHLASLSLRLGPGVLSSIYLLNIALNHSSPRCSAPGASRFVAATCG